ncbi:MAG TPA: NAD(P)H-hydrate dehydratase [Acidimicrobiales bacterium]|jgi:NAD(P)H-hydrate epimerase|nr:NAD(P)H-hydrate dehydratase [Acidimicrobiales bacterium]
MIPILSLAAMRDADRDAVNRRGQDALVHAAGTAVALTARHMLGVCYGARIAVVAGPGLNGADGRIAAAWLRDRGAHVDLIVWNEAPALLAGYDLIVDAAFGTGCSRPYVAPRVMAGTKVLAVDLPSGVDTDTGALLGEPMIATATLALGALKPAHLNGPAADFAGELHFESLGIVQSFDDGLMNDDDLSTFVRINEDDHKWNHAMQALVGSSLMPGAAELVLRGALAGGASMIRLVSRGDVASQVQLPPEVVHATDAKVDTRCKAVVAGPGLGPDASDWLRDPLSDLTCPVVLDADGLDRNMIDAVAPHDGSWVLTPHAGEFVRLSGHDLSLNRFHDVRELARATGCVVLLKGPTTIIASPEGRLRVVNSGTASLATAGTGDVLAGFIAATIARGHDPLEGAALGAFLHGRAGAALAPYAHASEVATTLGKLIGGLAAG